jgi:hypothetical protein
MKKLQVRAVGMRPRPRHSVPPKRPRPVRARRDRRYRRLGERLLAVLHPACVQGTWTCSGNVFIYTNPVGTWNYTLALVARPPPAASCAQAQDGPARLPSWGRPSEAISTGTKPGALTPTAAANLCRHTVSSPRTTPLRRATSEMLAPSSKLSATIRAFSCAVHRRRRRCPVITSIRR